MSAELASLDATATLRLVTVTPGMCGPTTLLAGRVGDWTWETVSQLCGIDVLRARLPTGEPTYLAFTYLHLASTPSLWPAALAFGDRLEVVSRPFDFGSESVLTVHRLRRLDGEEGAPRLLAAEEPYLAPLDGCLYVESFNRWVCRSRPESNEDLVRASPAGFRHRHLPSLPEPFSPRLVCQRARRLSTFRPREAADEPLGPGEVCWQVELDPSRDLNAVGLVYFAAYFALLDGALLRFYRRLGRSDAAFLRRVVLDQKLCYLGNAEGDAALTLTVRGRRAAGRPPREVFDVVFADRERTVALATVEIASGGEHGA